MTTGVLVTSDAGIKRSHNTDREGLTRSHITTSRFHYVSMASWNLLAPLSYASKAETHVKHKGVFCHRPEKEAREKEREAHGNSTFGDHLDLYAGPQASLRQLTTHANLCTRLGRLSQQAPHTSRPSGRGKPDLER